MRLSPVCSILFMSHKENIMQIAKEKNANVLNVCVSGRLDTNTAPSFEAEINKELFDVSELNMDVAGLVYISSAGLRVLLTLHKTMAAKGGKFTLLHPSNETMEILEMTGFSTFLNIKK